MMKNILFSLITIFILNFCPKFICAQINKKDTVEKVIETYLENWKTDKIQLGKYLSNENCNWKYAEENDINTLDIFGMPKDIVIHFGDINHDGIKDGIACIPPYQCDGGNGSMNFQFAVLIISSPSDYYILEKYPSVNLGMGGSFYHIESIIDGRIKATYFEYVETDGRCCPSIQKTVTLDFKDKFLYLNGKKVIME